MQEIDTAPPRCTCACSCGARPAFALDVVTSATNTTSPAKLPSTVAISPTSKSSEVSAKPNALPSMHNRKNAKITPSQLTLENTNFDIDIRDGDTIGTDVLSEATVLAHTNGTEQESIHSLQNVDLDGGGVSSTVHYTTHTDKTEPRDASLSHVSSAYDMNKLMSPNALRLFFMDEYSPSPRGKKVVAGPTPLAPWQRSHTGPDLSIKDSRVTATRKKIAATSSNGDSTDMVTSDSLLEEDTVLGVGNGEKRNSVTVGVLDRIVHREEGDEVTFGRLVKQQSLLRRRVNSHNGLLNFHELMGLFGVPTTPHSMKLAQEVEVPDDPDVFHTANCDILDLLLNFGREVSDLRTLRHEHEVFPMSISFTVAYRDIW
ncbi:hypothetical protein SARC_03812 [Sphaeroforma arctica JP610]|uniref:Uncharacterized protein n=1 Tax=Sphaeroforma arctica JP610 TaxID=667725 RepID=A0A0L0G6T5_9EUKA|nr:hypothetical protein SARC_03812 [Sphaeroforma arctica JP610]KNC83948.1 hypothetical protein SARC_03812 [Sphaeroforma arctica JP610]|eukprot:XP_014157850.1 hypothetical protein SARC_03812 [Sphaeroforma arctica JP610]